MQSIIRYIACTFDDHQALTRKLRKILHIENEILDSILTNNNAPLEHQSSLASHTTSIDVGN